MFRQMSHRLGTNYKPPNSYYYKLLHDIGVKEFHISSRIEDIKNLGISGTTEGNVLVELQWGAAERGDKKEKDFIVFALGPDADHAIRLALKTYYKFYPPGRNMNV